MRSAADTVLSEPDTVPITVTVEGEGEGETDRERVLESQLENPTQCQAEIPPHRLSHLGPLHVPGALALLLHLFCVLCLHEPRPRGEGERERGAMEGSHEQGQGGWEPKPKAKRTKRWGWARRPMAERGRDGLQDGRGKRPIQGPEKVPKKLGTGGGR